MPNFDVKVYFDSKDSRPQEPLKQDTIKFTPIIRKDRSGKERFAYMISGSEAILNPNQLYFGSRLSAEQLNTMRQKSDQVFFIDKGTGSQKLIIEMATRKILV